MQTLVRLLLQICIVCISRFIRKFGVWNVRTFTLHIHILCSLGKTLLDFSQDFVTCLQIATVLANMAAIESSRYDIIMYNGIPLLIGYLLQRPASFKQEAEVAACERVQQKAAIALTRLCKDVETAQTIVDLQGKVLEGLHVCPTCIQIGKVFCYMTASRGLLWLVETGCNRILLFAKSSCCFLKIAWLRSSSGQHHFCHCCQTGKNSHITNSLAEVKDRSTSLLFRLPDN